MEVVELVARGAQGQPPGRSAKGPSKPESMVAPSPVVTALVNGLEVPWLIDTVPRSPSWSMTSMLSSSQAFRFHLFRYSAYSREFWTFFSRCIEFLLTHNFFKFNGIYYLHPCWVSMDVNFSPSLTNLHIYGVVGGESHLYTSESFF